MDHSIIPNGERTVDHRHTEGFDFPTSYQYVRHM